MTQTILAIDYGLARVGLAWGSLATGLVSGKTTVTNTPSLFDELESYIAEHAVDVLLVGLPRGLDGQETQQTAICRQFAQQLEVFNMPVYLRDEAGTSGLAKERLGKNPPKEQIDAESAAIILEEYLHEQA